MKLTKTQWRIGTGAASAMMSTLIWYSAQHWSPSATWILAFACWMLGYIDGRVDHTLFLRDYDSGPSKQAGRGTQKWE